MKETKTKTAAELIPLPAFAVDAELRYKVSARPKRKFNNVMSAADLIVADDPRRSSISIHREPNDRITLRCQHPFSTGTLDETLTLKIERDHLVAQRFVRQVSNANGEHIRDEAADFTDRTWPLPLAVYPETVVPFLACWHPFDGRVRSFYAWINDRFVARTQICSLSRCVVSLPSGRHDAIEVIIYPDLNDWVSLGRALTRLLRPFLPKYQVWYAVAPPHHMLRYEGSYGPPGAPEIVLEREVL